MSSDEMICNDAEVVGQLNKLIKAINEHLVSGEKSERMLQLISEVAPGAFVKGVRRTCLDPWNELNSLVQNTPFGANLYGIELFSWVAKQAALHEQEEKEAIAHAEAAAREKARKKPINLGDRIKEQASYTTSDGTVFTSFDDARVHEARETFAELYAQEFGVSRPYPGPHTLLDWIKLNKEVVMTLLHFNNGGL